AWSVTAPSSATPRLDALCVPSRLRRSCCLGLRAGWQGHPALDVLVLGLAGGRREERGGPAGEGAALSRAPRGADRRSVLPDLHRRPARRDDPLRGLAAVALVPEHPLEHRVARVPAALTFSLSRRRPRRIAGREPF